MAVGTHRLAGIIAPRPAALVLVILGSLAAFAQSDRGTIAGSVTDSRGAVRIPIATA